ncbi:hypothetical protein NDU88_003811 [Pleurodeles waltl]|uniref:Uncharacterized protein n=1 Tax=Pleurodeles waltl TaxID=8319 RepID=A0AAV7M825_PLEWA|nr:hypothetical protein NDU88_003811 [Pleurodeles waltl]
MMLQSTPQLRLHAKGEHQLLAFTEPPQLCSLPGEKGGTVLQHSAKLLVCELPVPPASLPRRSPIQPPGTSAADRDCTPRLVAAPSEPIGPLGLWTRACGGSPRAFRTGLPAAIWTGRRGRGLPPRLRPFCRGPSPSADTGGKHPPQATSWCGVDGRADPSRRLDFKCLLERAFASLNTRLGFWRLETVPRLPRLSEGGARLTFFLCPVTWGCRGLPGGGLPTQRPAKIKEQTYNHAPGPQQPPGNPKTCVLA